MKNPIDYFKDSFKSVDAVSFFIAKIKDLNLKKNESFSRADEVRERRGSAMLSTVKNIRSKNVDIQNHRCYN